MRQQINSSRSSWTDAQDLQLVELYPYRSAAAIAKISGRSISSIFSRAAILGLEKSERYKAQKKAANRARVLELGKQYRYPKGSVPANKGTRRPGWFAGRMRETQFKKGQVSANYKPIGSLRTDVDGYVHIKIRDGIGGHGNPRVWPFLHRYNWEKTHGPIPQGHVLRFKNADKQNCDVGNLELITLRENCLRNSIHNLPPELKDVIRLKGAIKRTITWRSHGQEQAVRPAQPSL